MTDGDLISRKALLEEYPVENNPVHIAAKCAPAVDAVEVVRCKDCKHFYPHKNIPLCYAEGCFAPMGHDPEKWFCPLGERKDNKHD